MRVIQSRDNPLYKQVRRLAESARERKKSGLTLLDGMHLISAYIEAFGEPDTVLVSDSGTKQAEIAAFLHERADRQISVQMSDVLMRELGLVDTPSGIVALIAEPIPAQSFSQHVDTVVLDGVQDPGNLGTLLRTAAAAGFRQIVLSPQCTAAWSPKVLRAGQGAHFVLDLYENVDLPAFLANYQGLSLATRLTDAIPLYQQALSSPVAWVFGSEGQGVSADVLAQVSGHVFIPMPGRVESLNVSAAAAVCLFETLRQRTVARA